MSILDRGLLFGESIYEVLPVVDGRVRLLTEHAARMRSGARALGLHPAVPDDDALTKVGQELLQHEGLDEGILYLQVTGGAGPRVHVPAVPPPPDFFAFVQPLSFPRYEPTRPPLAVVTAADPRWARCDLKTTMLLPSVLARRDAPTADEVIFVADDDTVAEGGSTGVFLVEGQTIVLPPLSARVLPSVTRALVERIADAEGIAVESSTVSRARLLAADEVALASTTKLVLPVGQIDVTPVGYRPDGVWARLAGRLRVHYGLASD